VRPAGVPLRPPTRPEGGQSWCSSDLDRRRDGRSEQPSSTARSASSSPPHPRPLAVAGHGVEIVHIELRDLPTDVVKTCSPASRRRSRDLPVEQVSAADGLIVVTPIFSARTAGPFKSFSRRPRPGGTGRKPVPTRLRRLATGDGGSTGSALSERIDRPALSSPADRARRARPAADPFCQPHAVPGATQPLGPDRLIGRVWSAGTPRSGTARSSRGVELIRLEPVQHVVCPKTVAPAALQRSSRYFQDSFRRSCRLQVQDQRDPETAAKPPSRHPADRVERIGCRGTARS